MGELSQLLADLQAEQATVNKGPQPVPASAGEQTAHPNIELHGEEADGMVAVPSVDPDQFMHVLGQISAMPGAIMAGPQADALSKASPARIPFDAAAAQLVPWVMSIPHFVGSMMAEESQGGYAKQIQALLPGLKPFHDAQAEVGAKIRDFGLGVRMAYQEATQKQLAADMGPEPGTGAKIAAGVGSGAASVLEMVAAMYAGGPTAAMAVGATMFGGDKYNQLVDSGKDYKTAAAIAAPYGAVMSKINLAGLTKLVSLGRGAAATAMSKTMLVTTNAVKGAATMGAVSAVQSAGSEVVDLATGIKDPDAKQFLEDELVAIVSGSIVGGAAGAHASLTSYRTIKTKLSTMFPNSTPQEIARATSTLTRHMLNDSMDVLTSDLGITDKANTARALIDRIHNAENPTLSVENVPVEKILSPEEMVNAEKVKVDDTVAVESKIKELQSAIDEHQKIVAAEPGILGTKPVAEGMTRLYRVEPKDLGNKGEWLQKHMSPAQWKTFLSERGRLFSDNQESIKNYGWGEPTHNSFYVDVPTELAQKIGRQHPDGFTEYLVPKEIVDKKGVFERSVPGKEYSPEIKLQSSAEILKLQERQDALRSGMERAQGKIETTAGALRKQQIQTANELVRAYKSGQKFGVSELKSVRDAVLGLAKGLQLTPEQKIKVFKMANRATTVEKFQSEGGDAVIETLNDMLTQNKIEQYRRVSETMVKAMVEGAGGPKTKVFAEHLNQILKDRAPAGKYPEGSTERVFEQNMERLRADDLTEWEANNIAISLQDLLSKTESRYNATRIATARMLQRLVDKAVSSLELLKGGEKELTPEYVRATTGSNLEVLQNSRRAFTGPFGSPQILPTEFGVSMDAMLEVLDRGQRGENMTKFRQGWFRTMFGSFNAEQAYSDGITEKLGAFKEVYKQVHGSDWFNKQLAEITKAEYDIQFEGGRTERMTKADLMNLYFLSKMPRIREDLISKNKISSEWLQKFEENPPFSEGDMKIIKHMRDTLDQYRTRIADVWERLTGEPFRAIDDYFMVRRYMDKASDLGETLTQMVTGKGSDWESAVSPTYKDALKERTGSAAPIRVGNVYAGFEKYVMDMEHFLAFGEYMRRARTTFADPKVRTYVKAKLGTAYLKTLEKNFDNLASGGLTWGLTKDSESLAGKMVNNLGIGLMADAKQFFRQAGGFLQFVPRIGIKDLAVGAADVFRAAHSGDLKALLETDYMKSRYAGAYDYVVFMARQIAKAEIISDEMASQSGGMNALQKAHLALKKLKHSEAVTEVLRAAGKRGDQFASVFGGWAVFKAELAKNPDQPALAMKKAIEAIDDTQMSLKSGKLPLAYQRRDFANSLFFKFGRFPAQYLDNYMQTMREFGYAVAEEGKGNPFKALKAMAEGKSRLDLDTFARTVLTYHVIVPAFDAWIASGFRDEKRFPVYAAAGPAANMLLVGNLVTASTTYLMQSMGLLAKDVPAYMKEGTNRDMWDTFSQRVTKAFQKALKDPRLENILVPVADVAEVSGFPTGTAVRLGQEAVKNITSGLQDMGKLLRVGIGFSQ